MAKYNILILQFFIGHLLSAQTFTQTIKGNVQQKLLNTPVSNVTVILDNDSTKTILTDSNGFFQFENVIIGRHKLSIIHPSYNEVVLNNLLLNSGKELVLTIDIEERIQFTQNATITKKGSKNKPINEMATVSTRTFSVEETQKFAAAINDPARMATSFAGVVGGSDGGNSISIRGNSPTGMLWRLEGVDIPSPNHFSAFNASGGGISILSAQLMGNSDFMTGAFSADYGNALSGVFDIKLRKGNFKKREFTLQAGFLGLDLAAEGPLTKKGGSYLVNYRYSTLGILYKFGINIGGATTLFQDLSYNIYFPKSKLGQFTAFGIGGLSSSIQYAKKDSSTWKTESDKTDFIFASNTFAAGFTHFIPLGKKASLKNVVLVSATQTKDIAEFYKNDYNKAFTNYKNTIGNSKKIISSTLNVKISPKVHLRSGIIATQWQYNAQQRELDSTKILRTYLNQNGSTNYFQAYSQIKVKVSKKLSAQAGFHSMFLLLNKRYSLEPRAALSYQVKNNKTLSLGYGLHSQLQLPGVYFAQIVNAQNNIEYPNKNLNFSKAHHFVAGYEIMLKRNARIKGEVYYQSLFQIPIGLQSGSYFSILNQAWGIVSSPLQNKGKGQNYGLELTYEKYLTKGYYWLFSGSVYQSKYKTLTNKWINTMFNAQRAFTLTAGKEIAFKNNKQLLGFNLKTSWYGGFWQTPIDLEKSKIYKQTIEDMSKPFGNQLKDYFRTDIKVSFRNNHKKFNSIWSLDIQNVSNTKNIGGQYYDVEKQEIKTWFQNPLIPILSYKIEF